MTRVQARKWLFVSLAVAAAIFILREPLGDIAYGMVDPFDGNSYYSDGSWARFAADFFHERWALALSALVTVYLLYRYFAAEDSN